MRSYLFPHPHRPPPPDEVHHKLTELTWDTVATYMPSASGGSGEVKRKLKLLALAAFDPSSTEPWSVLDVGCGDGAALPHLLTAGADEGSYRGIDLSSKMLKRARSLHPKADFEQIAFEDVDLSRRFCAILFNGSLQFFADLSVVLKRASELLEPGPASRIVLSHVNGAAFVRSEAKGNPATVLSTMPSYEQLSEVAQELGLELISPEALGVGGKGGKGSKGGKRGMRKGGVEDANSGSSEDGALTGAEPSVSQEAAAADALLESFYLVALQRQR